MSVSSRHTNYTHAIVCKLSDSYATSCQNRSGVIDLSLAKSQFEAYVKALRDIGLDVIELPPDENFPDSVFVEDDAVICNGQALICRPGHPSRRGEVDFIRNIIKKELKLPIIEITDREATIDGGDVLFTGREFFVGISKRTNEAGARALASAFPDYPVTPIVITESFLHLKEVMTMGGADIFIVSEDKESQEILRQVAREATFTYHTVTVPDRDAANCVFANGNLIYRSDYPNTAKVLEEKLSCTKIPLEFSDIAKGAGSLTCCSLLIKKSKLIKKL